MRDSKRREIGEKKRVISHPGGFPTTGLSHRKRTFDSSEEEGIKPLPLINYLY